MLGAFLPETDYNPDGTLLKGRLEVNHKDEDKWNNKVSNLEWCDSAYNSKYGTRLSRIGRKGAKNKRAKKILCVETGEIFGCSTEIAELYNVNIGFVRNVTNPNDTHHQTLKGKHFIYIEEN